jgi:hypothetical protein
MGLIMYISVFESSFEKTESTALKNSEKIDNLI